MSNLKLVFTIDDDRYEAERITTIAWILLAMAGKSINTHYLTLERWDGIKSYEHDPNATIVLGDALAFHTHAKDTAHAHS